jgi:cytochrome c553
MKKVVMSLVVATLAISSGAVMAGDAAAGQAKSATCAGCHGANGISGNALWPNLAGQKEGYIVKAIKDFRDGNRKDPMMSAMAKGLTDDDAANLAAYFSSLK